MTFTIGSKFEHNEYTGFEYQPSARILWRIADNRSLWGALSRAVRTPSRINRDIRINAALIPPIFLDPDGLGPSPALPIDPDGSGPMIAGLPTLISIFGSDRFKTEEMLGLELGYRAQESEHSSLELSAFYNIYDNLYTSELGTPYVEGTPPTNLVLPLYFDNQIEGESYGLELAVNWKITPDWNLYTGYSWLKVDTRLSSSSTDTENVSAREESTPEHQFQLRSYWNVRHNLKLDIALYYSKDILVLNTPVPSHTRFDIRLGWNPTNDVELSLIGQNIFDNLHTEFVDEQTSSPIEVPQCVYGQIKVKF